MTMPGVLHLAAALLSLALGVLVLARRKGDAWHLRAGRWYVALMLVVNAAGLLVYQDRPGIGPFHVLAAVSLVTLAGAFLAIRRRPRTVGSVTAHGIMMGWSFAGLAAAGVGQGAADLAFPVWPSIAVTLVVGGGLIHRGRIAETARKLV